MVCTACPSPGLGPTPIFLSTTKSDARVAWFSVAPVLERCDSLRCCQLWKNEDSVSGHRHLRSGWISMLLQYSAALVLVAENTCFVVGIDRKHLAPFIGTSTRQRRWRWPYPTRRATVHPEAAAFGQVLGEAGSAQHPVKPQSYRLGAGPGDGDEWRDWIGSRLDCPEALGSSFHSAGWRPRIWTERRCGDDSYRRRSFKN